MSQQRRSTAVLLAVLMAIGVTGCTPDGPPPTCGEYTLDRGESIPQEAVDCMLERVEDDTLRVIAAPNAQGYTIATTYRISSAGGIEVTTEWLKHNGARFMKVCPDAVSVVELGECEELHEGD